MQLQVQINNITNPIPALSTGNFVMQIGNDISQNTTYSSITLTSAVLAQLEVTFSPAIVNTTEAMVFTMTLTNFLP